MNRTLIGALLATVLVLSGCSSDSDGAGDAGRRTSDPAPTPTLASVAPPVYVAIGASETVGVGAGDPATQAWPRLLHDRALPEAEFFDLGVSGATVRDALATQLPRALAAQPTVVTVWLAVNDAISLVPASDYARSLGELIGALRRETAATVLVGNVPPLDRLPAYRSCLPGPDRPQVACALPVVPPPGQVRETVAEFNAAIARVVAREGAVLVDLSGERDLTALTAADGFHPSTAGHRLLARRFGRALPH